MQEKSEELLPDSSFTEVSDNEKKALARHPRSAEDFPAEDKGQSHSQIYLVNKLNSCNFLDKPILVNFKHPKYDKSINFAAKPLPCFSDQLDCNWLEPPEALSKLASYRFNVIFVPDGMSFLLAEPEMLNMDPDSIRFKLPEKCYEVSTRQARRHECSGVAVNLSQHGSMFKGRLINFSAFSLHVQISADPPQAFHWINLEDAVTIQLLSEKETIFSGSCSITGHTDGRRLRDFFLKPLKHGIQRFNARQFRSKRLTVSPSPDAVFQHPFTHKMISLKVVDLSGSGFSVTEDEKKSMLLPGLIIPKLTLSFAMGISIDCRAQVVYQGKEAEDDAEASAELKCGIAILDMAPQHHAQLLSYLHQAENPNAYICNTVDLDALWDFFFETGFIYPEKYEFIEQNKDAIKQTYEKIYIQHPQIARHFIYQRSGHILGHVAILRFFSNTWLIHHHASRNSSFNRGGLIVLNQVGNFTYDSHRLHSLHMRYLICYFRSENKFPNRVFGGAAKSINDLNACSVDTLAYLHFQRLAQDGIESLKSWELTEADIHDLSELELFYQHESGGLMLEALDLAPEKPGLDALSRDYEKAGLMRKRHVYSLKKNGIIKAVIMVNYSDIGLNLSDLTNNIKVIVMEPDDLPKAYMLKTVSALCAKFDQEHVPVMIYPASYADQQAIPYEKKYNLWVLDTHYSDQYFRFVNRLLKFA